MKKTNFFHPNIYTQTIGTHAFRNSLILIRLEVSHYTSYTKLQSTKIQNGHKKNFCFGNIKIKKVFKKNTYVIQNFHTKVNVFEKWKKYYLK